MKITLKAGVIILLFFFLFKPIQAYYTYKYQNNKLYYYDNKVNDGSIGYFFWGTVLGANYPAILGGLFIVGGINACITERDYLGSSVAVGVGGIELYLQSLPDKNASYIINGGLAVLGLFSGFFETEPLYPPKFIYISPQIFYREDIHLSYNDAKKIYFNLMDSGYILSQPYQSKLTNKFNPNQKTELPGDLNKFSEHIHWILKQVYEYNEKGDNPNIKFETP